MNGTIVTNKVAAAALNLRVPFRREGKVFSIGNEKYRLTDFDIYSYRREKVMGLSEVSDYEKALAIVNDYNECRLMEALNG